MHANLASVCAALELKDTSMWVTLCEDSLQHLRADCTRVLGADWLDRIRAANEGCDDAAALCACWRDFAVERGCTVALGQTETPASVVQLLLSHVPPLRCPRGRSMKRVLDPATGSGVLLGALLRRSVGSLLTDDDPMFCADVLTNACAALWAYDVDEASCIFTRLNLLCASIPLLRCIATDPDLVAVWRLPRWSVINRSATDLFDSDAAKQSFDVVLMNPPFRNKQRELDAGGRAFAFLRSEAWRATNATTPHHNLYGYFLWLALYCCRAAPSSVVVAVVLRNVLNLHKYPEDVHFHRALLQRNVIHSVSLLKGDAFAGLPRDTRHNAIESCVLVLRPDRARAAACRATKLSSQLSSTSSGVRAITPPSVTTLVLHGGTWVPQSTTTANDDNTALDGTISRLGLAGLDAKLRMRVGDAALQALWETHSEEIH